jgi:hypothetical protein
MVAPTHNMNCSILGLLPSATITLGSPRDAEAHVGPAGVAFLHPDLDVALVRAGWLPVAMDKLQPIRPNTVALDESWVGSPVEIAGYGLAADRTIGALAFAVEEVTRIEPSYVIVHGMGQSGACAGDSGGPLLARTNDGGIGLVGILDDGDPSCVGEDAYTRVDQLVDWEPFSIALSVGESGPIACGSLTATGTCQRNRAFWCSNDAITIDDCQAVGRTCGWNPASDGFRCVAPTDDPCQGLGSFARCEQATVVVCARGAIERTECGTCGGECAPWVDGQGAGCRR